MKKYRILFTLSSILCALSLLAATPEQLFSLATHEQTPTQSIFTIAYDLPANTGVLVDDIHISLKDAPSCQIQSWKSSEKTTTCTTTTQELVACFTQKGTLQVIVLHAAPEALCNGSLIISFRIQNDPEKIRTEEISLHPLQPNQEKPLASQSYTLNNTLEKIKNYVSSIVEQAESPVLQLLLILILGLLMSLTPCIYPMIPITIGIIQSNKAQSLRKNFILACAYALGIALTFAIMGFVVAMGGAQFGALLGKPWFIVLIVAFLGYFAGSMLGFYEVRLPQFSTGDQQNIRQGSIKSAFFFGAVSGTVTSPCLSPGLVLVLGMVAKLKVIAASWWHVLQNSLLGFSYLFTFGIGLSIPLIIIATFSGSADKLPRSGLWMVEVKKIFGFLLVALCFSYLHPLLSPALLYILAGTILIILALLLQRKKTYGAGTWLKRYILLLNSIVFILGAFFIGYGLYAPYTKTSHLVLPTIEEALTIATNENKPYVLIEFGASWCSSCTKIQKNIFTNMEYHAALPQVVFAHCDCTKANDLRVQSYQKEYAITQGLPVVILLDGKTKKEIKRWRSEIVQLSPEQLAKEITR